jgi:hypothetical protein
LSVVSEETFLILEIYFFLKVSDECSTAAGFSTHPLPDFGERLRAVVKYTRLVPWSDGVME